MALAYDQLCVGQSGSAAVLAAADQAGWSKSAPDLPRDFKPDRQRVKVMRGVQLRVYTDDTRVGDETMFSCGIMIETDVPDLVTSVRAELGFEPTLQIGNTANFFGIREGTGWRNARGVPKQAFAKAKAEARYYSVIVTQSPERSMLFSLRISPALPIGGASGK